jgi:hypothetical protein
MTSTTVVHIPDDHDFTAYARKIYAGGEPSYYMKFTVYENGSNSSHEVVIHASERTTLDHLMSTLDTQLSKITATKRTGDQN